MTPLADDLILSPSRSRIDWYTPLGWAMFRFRDTAGQSLHFYREMPILAFVAGAFLKITRGKGLHFYREMPILAFVAGAFLKITRGKAHYFNRSLRYSAE